MVNVKEIKIKNIDHLGFIGMLLAGMLRRSAALNPLSYSREDYIESCVDIFVRGISADYL